MTHNEFVEFMKKNAERVHTDKEYSMADYNRDCDNVEVLPFDLEHFGLVFSEEQMKVINAYFTEESVSKLGNMRLVGHLTYLSERVVANRLGIDMVENGSYSGFGKNDANRCVFEFCEGDIYLIFCESQKEYLAELKSYCEFYKVESRFFAEGSYNLYRGLQGNGYGEFIGKAFTEKEVKDFILDFAKRYPDDSFTVSQDYKIGYNQSSMDVTDWFFRALDGRLPYPEDNACVEVYFDGVLVDNVYTPMDKADMLVCELAQKGFDGCCGDVKEDWLESGGRGNPEVSFKVVPYPEKTFEAVLDSAHARAESSSAVRSSSEMELS